MAIVKKNTYVPGTNNDITNVCLNMDYNRLGTDITRVEWNGTAFLVKAGSLVECNGSLYAVEGSDITLTAADGALYFDSSTVTFSISSGAAAYDPTKAGHYATATKRLLKWSMLSDGTILTAGREFQYTGAKSFSFVPPAECESIKLAICAQGGNGGAGATSGGGGAGACFYGLKAVTPGTAYPIVLSTSTNSTAFGMTMGKGSNGGSGSPGAGGAGGAASGGATVGASGGSATTSPSIGEPGNGSIMAGGGLGTAIGGGGGGGAGGGGGVSGGSGSGFNGPGAGGAGLFGAGSRGATGGGAGGAGGFGAGGGAGVSAGGAGGAPLVNIRL